MKETVTKVFEQLNALPKTKMNTDNIDNSNLDGAEEAKNQKTHFCLSEKKNEFLLSSSSSSPRCVDDRFNLENEEANKKLKEASESEKIALDQREVGKSSTVGFSKLLSGKTESKIKSLLLFLKRKVLRKKASAEKKTQNLEDSKSTEAPTSVENRMKNGAGVDYKVPRWLQKQGFVCPYVYNKTFKGKYGIINYEICGKEGDPVIVTFHGLNGTNMTFLDVQGILSKYGFRVLTFDLYGHGLSASPSYNLYKKSYGLKFFVKQTDEIIKYLGLQNEPLNLIGFSMGCCIAAAYCIKYPDKVERVVFISPAGMLPHKPATVKMLQCCPCSIHIAPCFISRCCFDKQRFIMKFSKEERDSGVAEGFWSRLMWQLFVKKGVLGGFLGCVTNIPLWESKPIFIKMGQTNKPVLLLWGKKDNVCPAHTAENVLKCFPNGHLILFKDSTHLLLTDQPQSAIATIMTFLEFPSDAIMEKWKYILPFNAKGQYVPRCNRTPADKSLQEYLKEINYKPRYHVRVPQNECSSNNRKSSDCKNYTFSTESSNNVPNEKRSTVNSDFCGIFVESKSRISGDEERSLKENSFKGGAGNLNSCKFFLDKLQSKAVSLKEDVVCDAASYCSAMNTPSEKCSAHCSSSLPSVPTFALPLNKLSSLAFVRDESENIISVASSDVKLCADGRKLMHFADATNAAEGEGRRFSKNDDSAYDTNFNALTKNAECNTLSNSLENTPYNETQHSYPNLLSLDVVSLEIQAEESIIRENRAVEGKAGAENKNDEDEVDSIDKRRHEGCKDIKCCEPTSLKLRREELHKVVKYDDLYSVNNNDASSRSVSSFVDYFPPDIKVGKASLYDLGPLRCTYTDEVSIVAASNYGNVHNCDKDVTSNWYISNSADGESALAMNGKNDIMRDDNENYGEEPANNVTPKLSLLESCDSESRGFAGMNIIKNVEDSKQRNVLSFECCDVDPSISSTANGVLLATNDFSNALEREKEVVLNEAEKVRPAFPSVHSLIINESTARAESKHFLINTQKKKSKKKNKIFDFHRTFHLLLAKAFSAKIRDGKTCISNKN